ncbi:MAG: IS5 family transposase [Bacteroidetes bacterium]|nr:IS5 family transposase [Bacteroidota bacterium]
MRTNKINNIDLFTQAANDGFEKHIKTQSKRALETINQKINWNDLIAPIEQKLEMSKNKNSEAHPGGQAGRRPFSLEVIVKCFILQTIYNLSDPRLEEELADRRSFQIFLGITSGDSIPDETTLVRYRKTFSSLGLDKMLFDGFNKQLDEKQLIVGKGTIVDATIKQAQATPFSNKDQDANFTKKRGKTYYGYKGHIAIDEDSRIIKRLEFTKASVHDSNEFDNLIDYTEEAVFADKGYANKPRRKKLQANGIFDGILEKGYRSKPLSKIQKKVNRLLSSVRNEVEKTFAFMKNVLGYDRCSYYDLKTNRFEFTFVAIVFNIRRMISLTT